MRIEKKSGNSPDLYIKIFKPANELDHVERGLARLEHLEEAEHRLRVPSGLQSVQQRQQQGRVDFGVGGEQLPEEELLDRLPEEAGLEHTVQ